MSNEYKEIPEKAWFATSEVANILGLSTTTVITYAKRCGLHENLIRRRRGDYLFTYNQVAQLRAFAFAYEQE